MPEQITVRGRQAAITIELNTSDTAAELLKQLPFDARSQIWGDEIYFSSPVDADNAPGDEATVAVADVAYWPPGKAICLFYGPTPISTDDRPVAANPVTVVGRIIDGLEDCRRVGSGEILAIERG